MKVPKIITRREFIGSAAVGSVTSATVAGQILPTPTPTQLGAPVLDGDDLDARTSTRLRIKWAAVAGVISYELECSWSTGSTSFTTTQPNFKVSSLERNRTYKLRYKTVSPSVTSEWSLPFTTATRPPAPPAPSMIAAPMIAVPQAGILHWDLTDLVKGLDDLPETTVMLGREVNGQIGIHQRGLKTTDTISIHHDTIDSIFRICLNCKKTGVVSLPNEENISFWSSAFRPTSHMFPHLRFPQRSETKSLSISRLRNYYG